MIALPGPRVARYRLAETTISGQAAADESSLFDGIDNIGRRTDRFPGERPPGQLVAGLAPVARHAREALEAFERHGMHAARAPTLMGLAAVRDLRGRLGRLGLSDDARWEIDSGWRPKSGSSNRPSFWPTGFALRRWPTTESSYEINRSPSRSL